MSTKTSSVVRRSHGVRRPCLVRDSRGATVVEYALILSLVLVGASPLLKSVGVKVRATFEAAVAGFDR